jgi:Ribulose-5-phosphate 4-epimerase and related epimerases and aldolases
MGRLTEVGRNAVDRGLVLASGGNLSARLPGSDEFVVTAGGTWLDNLSPDDFTIMRTDGTVLGGAERPSSEWKLHSKTYIARADVSAVIHLHPQYSVLLDALGHDIRLITLDHAYYVRSVGRTPYFPNGSDELADSAAEQSLEHNCIVMGHHGCSAIGPDISMAYRRALNLEEAATQTYRALALGDTRSSFPADALASLGHT